MGEANLANIDGLKLLRVAFPGHQVSKLPKPTKAQTDALKADFKVGVRCTVCGGWHHPKVVHLDYVGHAALTDRLLDADPLWTWEPMSIGDNGLPRLDANGGMWIRLTVCGVTRLGYGHAGDKTGGDAVKEVIGDALRNAGMRFGAALDLWHKGDLHKDDEETKPVTKITDDAVDQEKVSGVVAWFKEQIDIDQIETTYPIVKAGWEKLSNNERLAVDAQLRDKAPNSNKMYKNLLKEYLAYVPEINPNDEFNPAG